jgi:hypothetical protein
MLLTQADIHHYVFRAALQGVAAAVVVPYLTEYLRSVFRHGLLAAHDLHVLLVDLLIQERRYFEFHQHLQYHILSDSIHIAQRLLALSPEYPPAYQLALDMLYRLSAFDILMSTLLQHGEVIEALRLVSHKSSLFDIEGLFPRDFLRVALATKDPNVFYSAYKFFEARNFLLRGSRAFDPADGCEEYLGHFVKLFGSARPERQDEWFHAKDEEEYVESDDEGDDAKLPLESKSPKEKGVDPIVIPAGAASGGLDVTPFSPSEGGGGTPAPATPASASSASSAAASSGAPAAGAGAAPGGPGAPSGEMPKLPELEKQ